MSVLIKGMEMPKSCGECKAFVCYRQWAGDSGDCFCGITKSDAKVGARNADCPLVPVPKHGDLIDRDALKPYMLNEHYKHRLVFDADEVANAPTIIPASEGE